MLSLKYFATGKKKTTKTKQKTISRTSAQKIVKMSLEYHTNKNDLHLLTLKHINVFYQPSTAIPRREELSTHVVQKGKLTSNVSN